MGYDLFNGKHAFRTNISVFPRLLNLAFLYGWMPKGTVNKITEDNTSEKCDGTYLSNGGQFVTPEDALEIADALERAFGEIPELDLMDENDQLFSRHFGTRPTDSLVTILQRMSDFINEEQHYDITENNKPELFKYFGNKILREKLRSFINYCHRGGFTIN